MLSFLCLRGDVGFLPDFPGSFVVYDLRGRGWYCTETTDPRALMDQLFRAAWGRNIYLDAFVVRCSSRSHLPGELAGLAVEPLAPGSAQLELTTLSS